MHRELVSRDLHTVREGVCRPLGSRSRRTERECKGLSWGSSVWEGQRSARGWGASREGLRQQMGWESPQEHAGPGTASPKQEKIPRENYKQKSDRI